MGISRRQVLASLLAAASPAAETDRIGRPGFVHVRKRADVWWFVGADGKEFVSVGANHVEPHLWLGPYNREATLKRYGSDFVQADGKFNPSGAAARRWMDSVLATVERLGFNTLGKHTNPIIPPRLYWDRIPYIASIEAGPIASWQQKQDRGPFPDVFSPAFEKHLAVRVAEVCRAHASKKKLLGYVYCDIPWWALNPLDQKTMGLQAMIHPWVNQLLRTGADTPGKQKWIELLRSRYDGAPAAARVFGMKTATWDGMAASTEWFAPAVPDRAKADSEAFIAMIAERWYKLHRDEIRKHDANHLIFGDKMQPAPDWVLPIAGKSVDVNIMQWRGTWKESVKDYADRLYRVTGKPVIMGDATQSFLRPQQRENSVKGLLPNVQNYADMSRAYAQYVEEAFHEPYFIGYHHCGFIEQWDGSDRGDVATNENGLIDPFEKIDPAVASIVPPANRRAGQWHAEAKA